MCGVVPVQQVPLVALQPFDRGQRRVDPANQLRRLDESEIVSGERREKTEADVGRRRPVCDSELDVHLHVVWRKRVVGGPVEGLEVPPRLPRDAAEELAIGRRQRGAPSGRRAAQDEGDDRRASSTTRGSAARPASARGRVPTTTRTNAPMASDGLASIPVTNARSRGGPASSGARRRRLPLQQPMLRDAEPHERDGDGMQPLVRFGRHERHLEPRTRRGGRQVVKRRAQDDERRAAPARSREHGQCREHERQRHARQTGHRPHRPGFPAERSSREGARPRRPAAAGSVAGCRESSSATAAAGGCACRPERDGANGNSHQRICQSPRTQRCWRRACARTLDG